MFSLLLLCSLLIDVVSIQFESDNTAAIFNTIDWIPLDSNDNNKVTGGGVDREVNSEKLRPSPPVSNSWNDPSVEIFVGNRFVCLISVLRYAHIHCDDDNHDDE